jgi:hypothetical protein
LSVAVAVAQAYVIDSDSSLVAVGYGQVLWRVATSATGASPTLFNGVIYVDGATSVDAFTTAGKVVFRQALRTAVAAPTYTVNPPRTLSIIGTGSNNGCYIYRTDAGVEVIDCLTGQVLARSQYSANSVALGRDGTVYTSFGNLVAFAAGDTLQLMWQFSGAQFTSTPVVGDGYLLTVDTAGSLYRINQV